MASRPLDLDKEKPKYGDVVSWTPNGVLRMVVGFYSDNTFDFIRLNYHSTRVVEHGWWYTKLLGGKGWWLHE